MEKTMFAAFSAKSIMHATLQRLSGLDGWKDSITVTGRSFSAKKGGTYMTEIRTLRQGDESHTDETSKVAKEANSRLKPLDEAIRVAMEKSESDLRHELGCFHCPEDVHFQDRVTIREHEFTTYRTSQSHGVIFFQDTPGTSALVPGMVRAIFLVRQDSTSQHIFLAVHRFLAPATSLPNPFTRYPDFGAGLWSSETQKEVTIVPGNRCIYHAIYRDWDYKIMVMKPLNRVSNSNLI